MFTISAPDSTTHKKCNMEVMVEHVRANVFKNSEFLTAQSLQMIDGSPLDEAITKMERLGRENQEKYYKRYLDGGKPDETCLTKLPKEKYPS